MEITVLGIVSCLILAATGIVQNERCARERATWAAERARLLDRIMARNYNEFAYTAHATATTAETPQMTTDEAEAKWAAEHESADAAWHAENKIAHPELYPEDGATE